MFSILKQFFIGKPLETSEIKHAKFPVLFGLAILASDAISSVAYATEEILWVLIPAIGLGSYKYLLGISVAIILLLMLLVFSYRQTINTYPNGGGAYMVAKENISVTAGLVAGASLAVDYVLTVAVSTSAGTAALTSAFPALSVHKVSICLALISIITIVNLRGVKESAAIFSIPTYIFVFSMIALIATGLVKYSLYGAPATHVSKEIINTTGPVTIFLILRAFSSGCTALSGVEAVSNSVPNFKSPSSKNANIVLALLALIVLIIFGGITLLATIYHVVPQANGPTVISQITSSVFGTGTAYYIIQFATALILVMASNTAFNGFPMLMSVISCDGYAPRQLMLRGTRLSYSNGIIILAVISTILIILFRGDTHLLIPLYAVGVFLSFTLSQLGMTFRWIRNKDKGWIYKALVNGLGTLVTAITLVIIVSTKFIHGAWIVVILIPIIVKLMLSIKKHYDSVANDLRISIDELKQIDINPQYNNKIIVPIASINRAVIETLKYAQNLSKDVVALHIAVDEDSAKKWISRWNDWNPDIPLVVRFSPYREVVEPLRGYIDELLEVKNPNDKITIMIPQFIAVKDWENYFLHNQTSFFIKQGLLLKHKEVVVCNYPYYVDKN